jgi:hypothetical protein
MGSNLLENVVMQDLTPARRRTIAVCAAVLAGAGLIAAVIVISRDSGAASDKAAATKVVRSFIAAARSQDFGTACRLMSTRSEPAKAGPAACPRKLRRALNGEQWPDPNRLVFSLRRANGFVVIEASKDRPDLSPLRRVLAFEVTRDHHSWKVLGIALGF